LKRTKRRKREKNIFSIGLFLFVLGFMALCQHMNVIRLGYTLSQEKALYKELSNFNRILTLEKTYLNSPRYLNKLASADLGLAAGTPALVRKVSIIPSPAAQKNKASRKLARLFGFNSEALAKTVKK
jgi:hypothetical protein